MRVAISAADGRDLVDAFRRGNVTYSQELSRTSSAKLERVTRPKSFALEIVVSPCRKSFIEGNEKEILTLALFLASLQTEESKSLKLEAIEVKLLEALEAAQ